MADVRDNEVAPVTTPPGSPRAARDEPDWKAVAKQLYDALDGIYIEEINGRLCALPDTLPGFGDDDEEQPRENRCCPSCKSHWARTKEAIAAYDALAPSRRSVYGR